MDGASWKPLGMRPELVGSNADGRSARMRDRLLTRLSAGLGRKRTVPTWDQPGEVARRLRIDRRRRDAG